jgi:hypothetical protein
MSMTDILLESTTAIMAESRDTTHYSVSRFIHYMHHI